MTITRFEGEELFPFDSIFFDDQINRIIEAVLPRYDRLVKKYVLFHIFFALLGVIELALLFFCMNFLVESSLLALAVGAVFFTFFSYFTLRLYLENWKLERLEGVKKQYLAACCDMMGYREEIPEHHLALANACARLAALLEGREFTYYQFPKWLNFLGLTMQKFSHWCHWQDVNAIRELLLKASAEQHVKLVKLEPTSLEVHASLANAYVSLSGLYSGRHLHAGHGEERKPLSKRLQQEFEQKFREAAQMAIEEFKILNHYAPDDPWVHLQLAYSYHDLGMPEEEIAEFETVLALCPDDLDTLYKLGILYFQQGHNEKGLKVYDRLKGTHYKKAEQLIEHYGDRARHCRLY